MLVLSLLLQYHAPQARLAECYANVVAAALLQRAPQQHLLQRIFGLTTRRAAVRLTLARPQCDWEIYGAV